MENGASRRSDDVPERARRRVRRAPRAGHSRSSWQSVTCAAYDDGALAAHADREEDDVLEQWERGSEERRAL
ncbi:hypothetical protein [Streptomyces sp. NPDC058595]|uniref:hypothetical protein n=1 Tax=Streptomyces sp. NPDC058595 TaxID=3346550 RepID=UPI003655EDEE